MKTEFVTFDHFTHEMFGCDSQRVVIHKETKPIIDAYMYFTAGDLLYTSQSLSSLTEANNELHITVFRSIAT